MGKIDSKLPLYKFKGRPLVCETGSYELLGK